MKLKGWITALAVCTVISLTGTLNVGAVGSQDFPDLKDLDSATKAKFDAMIGAGVFDGVGASQFGLKEEMNRAEFAKVASLIYGLDLTKAPSIPSFNDVPNNHYALPFIEAIKAAGITDGVGEGKFDPEGKVTKEQLATFLVRGLGKSVDDQIKGDDTTISDWAQGYVAAALQLKLLSNGASGLFEGKGKATRDLLVLSSYEAARQAAKIVLTLPTESPEPIKQPSPTEPKEPIEQPSPTEPKEPIEQPLPAEPQEPVEQPLPKPTEQLSPAESPEPPVAAD